METPQDLFDKFSDYDIIMILEIAMLALKDNQRSGMLESIDIPTDEEDALLAKITDYMTPKR
jgi:hypothetical protein